MKIFIDTANLDEIKEANSWGIIDGVTTNPTLASIEGYPSFEKLTHDILSIFTKPMDVVNFEVASLDAKTMIEEGIKLASLSKHVVVKVPVTQDGLIACKELTKRGIRVNVTLCFSPTQALMAAKAGAYFISPFVGRLDDQNEDGMRLIEQIKKIYTNYGMKTQILVASIRGPHHVMEAALLGADACTIPYSVFEKLFRHELTDVGINKFLDDWKKTKFKIK